MKQTARYLLSRHVHLCASGNYVVLLDLRNDRYMALDVTRTGHLADLIPGWPGGMNADAPALPAGDDAANPLLRAMLQKGLLTTDEQLGKSAAPMDSLVPNRTLLDMGSLSRRNGVTGGHVAAFATASLSAAVRLKWGKIERTVAGVTRRRRAADNSVALDVEHAGALVATFNRLRPFAFTARQACLFDSLSLLNFLAHYGLFPHWVFGVQTTPFAAHCWVQDGDAVFNDTPEYVKNFTPIMAA